MVDRDDRPSAATAVVSASQVRLINEAVRVGPAAEAAPDGGRTAKTTPQPPSDAGKGAVVPVSSQEPAEGPGVTPLPPPRPLAPPVEAGPPGPAMAVGPPPLANPLAAPTAAGGL